MEEKEPHALEMGKEKAQKIEKKNQKKSRRTLTVN